LMKQIGGLIFALTFLLAGWSTASGVPIAEKTNPTATPTQLPELASNWSLKAPMPTARWKHAASVVDGKIYVFGGVGGSEKVEMYDPETDTWAQKSDIPTPRNFLATSVVDGKIYVMGGNQDLWGDPLATVEVYDPETDTWESKAEMPMARAALSTASLNGKIYVFGGSGDCDTNKCKVIATVDEYDPETDTWQTVSEMPTPRLMLATCVIDDQIYVIGGMLIIAGPGSWAVEAYHPETNTWEEKANLPSARTGSASVVADTIYVSGGVAGGGGIAHASLFAYDIAMDTWTRIEDMPMPLLGTTASVVDDRVYVVGGSASKYPHKPYLATVFEFTPDN
jgi:N-acetylneuraminic acid mutarotase